MAEIKWVKLSINLFDDEKIKLIQSMPDGDTLVLIWVRLITLAGKTNANGYVYVAEEIPYTEEMLSTVLSKSTDIIHLALTTFQKFKMIDVDEKGIFIINFGKHQNLDGMDKVREQNRLRAAKYRENKKQILENDDNVTVENGDNVTSRYDNVTVTQQNKNKNKNKNILLLSGADTAPDSKKAFFSLPLNDNSEFPVTREQVDEWAGLYPAVDVIQQLNNMRGWLTSNPRKRKTKSGILKFVTNWLMKAQDKPQAASRTAATSEPVGYEGVRRL